jgi:hypothetical protein
MLTAPTISTPASRLRVLHGVALPAVPPEPRQEMLALSHSAMLPAGFSIFEDAAGLHLVRDADGANFGIMASLDVACTQASASARMEAMRLAQQETAA